jgi:hypothetical protein
MGSVEKAVHWLELCDFRYSWTLETLEALDRGLSKLSADQQDGLDLLEHAEELVGLAFVALQGYVSATTADLRDLSPTLALTNEDLRARNSPAASGVTHIEAIWAAGNYYKHHDEWPDWTPVAARRNTILTLGSLGISSATEFRCVETMKALHGSWVPLPRLLQSASEWRDAWVSELGTGMVPTVSSLRT